MTAASAAAFWRGNASRRRRADRPRPAPPDIGTDQTRRNLTAPPWADWPSELICAAIDIDLAVRLIAGSSLVQAQGGAPQARGVMAGDWAADSHEAHLVRRYCGWRATMRRKGWPAGPVLEAVVFGRPAADPWPLRRALQLYATGRILGGA